jgi:hypothetical protein
MPLLGLEKPEGDRPDAARHGVRIAGDHTAYLFATVDLPADGTLLVNTAADWHMAWHIDGRRVYDTLNSGNGTAPRHPMAHTFKADLKAGRHVLAVLVKPGSRGWSLTSLGALATKPVAGLAERFPAKGAVKVTVEKPVVAPALKVLQDPAEARRDWLDRIRANRDRLERIAAQDADEGQAAAARAMLDALTKAEAEKDG